MIKIAITGSVHEGKTLTSMRIAALLSAEGYDIELITEPTNYDVLVDMYNNSSEQITKQKLSVCIHDTNGQPYRPDFHDFVHLPARLYNVGRI